MFSDYGCSDDESRKKRSVEDDLGTKMPCSLCIYKSEEDLFYFKQTSNTQINPSVRPGIKLRNKEGKTVSRFCQQLLEIVDLFHSKIYISCPVWGKFVIRRSHLTCCVVNSTEEKICCDMARDTENVTCVRLAFDSNKDLSYRCRNAFWKCCIKLHGEEGNSF